MEKRMFKSIKDNPPELGVEVILFNQKWIDEDNNPKGIRIGFYDDVTEWTSSYWCNYHDEYHTRVSCEDDEQFLDSKGENQIPTHWVNLPIFNIKIEIGRCPVCGAKEVSSNSPRTVYECGSSDYDQRNGTFKQSNNCIKK